MKKIQYYVKPAWGNDYMYIKDPELKLYFQVITNRDTIDERIMEAFKKLGIEFEQVIAPRK